MMPTVEIGSSHRTVGHKGGIKLKIHDNYAHIFSKAKIIIFSISGDLVPFWPVQIVEKNNNFIVTLEDINNPEEAQELLSRQIHLLEKEVIELIGYIPTETKHPMIGYLIMDQYDQKIGFIEKVESYPQQDMAIVNHLGENKLIPLSDHLIIRNDKSQKVLLMELPDGLLDL